MMKVDQGLRHKAKPGKELINYLIYAVDNVHNFRIKEIIKKYGYPKKALLGKETMRAFWLLIQHQDDDLDLQEKCLKYCDFDSDNKAYLTDRVLVNKGKKQIYGTQFNKPIRDIKNVDIRREKMGLGLLKDYLVLAPKKQNICRNKQKNI